MQVQKILRVDVIPLDQLSSKFNALARILLDHQQKDEPVQDLQAIVFVERRAIAHLVPSLLERSAGLKGFIRAVALTGHASSNDDQDFIGVKMDSKTQNKTVSRFRTGEYNLTVATSVAEEGLDFRSCSLVIRFDQITTWKGYIQSRGRARARNSEYIVMLPHGSSNKYLSFREKEDDLKATLFDRQEDEHIEDGELEPTPQLICRLSDGKDSILTYTAATSLLNDVCQLIPQDDFLPVPKPEFKSWPVGDEFQCQVTLPPMAALPPSRRTFVGVQMATKKDAKRSAAFEACKVLREVGVLNEHFIARREGKTVQAQDANGRQIETSPLPEQIEAIVTNVFGDPWNSSELWLHKVSFSHPDRSDPSDDPSDLALICGDRLTQPRGFQLFDSLSDPTRPMSISIDEIHKLCWNDSVLSDRLEKLERFTRLVIQAAVSRKGYDGKLFFLVVPLIQTAGCEIDWELVENPISPLSSINNSSNYPCLLAPHCALRSRIFHTFEPCEDFSESTPSQLLPNHPHMRAFLKRISKFKTLGHFYKVVYKLEGEESKSPLVYLESTFHNQNNLLSAPSSTGPVRILLPLSICRGSHLPISTWRAFSYLPSLTRILHDVTQVTRLFQKLNLTGVSLLLGTQALTPPGVGVPWDYQTLETVGDAFLKLATSVHIYLTHLGKGEGEMSWVRAKSVDNDFLRRKAIQANLNDYILGQRFRADTFRDAQTEDGVELPNGKFLRKVPRRVLSDTTEALLGAGFLSVGIQLGLQIGTALDLCFGGTTPWNQRDFKKIFDASAESNINPSTLSTCRALEDQIGYKFEQKLLLVQALTHRSANSFLTNCYEREEWLGDAVIDMWVVEHTYRRFQGVTAEQLTRTRAKLVSNGSLGFLALRKLSLHHKVLHNSDSFKLACSEALEAIRSFERIEGFYEDTDNLFVIFDPPKILNDCLEAIVGAVFIDSGFDLPTAYRILDFIFEDVTPGLSQSVLPDPLSRLLTLRDKQSCRKLERTSLTIRESDPEGEDHEPVLIKACRVTFHGREIAVGRHPTSTSVAEQRAALQTLKLIECFKPGDDQYLFSECDCQPSSDNHERTKTEGASTAMTPARKVEDGVGSSLQNDQDLLSSLLGKKNKNKRAQLRKSLRVEIESSLMCPVISKKERNRTSQAQASNDVTDSPGLLSLVDQPIHDDVELEQVCTLSSDDAQELTTISVDHDPAQLEVSNDEVVVIETLTQVEDRVNESPEVGGVLSSEGMIDLDALNGKKNKNRRLKRNRRARKALEGGSPRLIDLTQSDDDGDHPVRDREGDDPDGPASSQSTVDDLQEPERIEIVSDDDDLDSLLPRDEPIIRASSSSKTKNLGPQDDDGEEKEEEGRDRSSSVECLTPTPLRPGNPPPRPHPRDLTKRLKTE